MSWDDDSRPPATMVDLVFPLTGRAFLRDHSLALQQSLTRVLPWLEEEAQAGIHAIKLAHGGTEAMLSARSRLLLRLPRARASAAGVLAGQTLAVAGHPVQLGQPHVRELLPHATLYAHAVAAPGDDEAEFMRQMAEELQALGVRSHTVCGKRQQRQAEDGPLTAFSLMLHGLALADARRVLESGLGPRRLLGCGLFVPHKSAAAVGE